MSQLGSVIDYVNRTIDLLAYQGVSATGNPLLDSALWDGAEGGEVCTGVQKLVQRWLIEFLTVQGSLTYLPARGCAFMLLLRQGQLHTTTDIEQAFFLSAQQVQLNLTAEETAAMPEDEQFASAALDSVTISGETVSLYVTILSQAGTTAPLILPINVLNG